MTTVAVSFPSNGTLTSSLNIPIVEDGSLQLSTNVRQAYNPNTPLNCTLEDAVSAADRYMHVYGQPPNPLQLVTEWLNLLRWEIAHFWTVDSVNNEITPSATLAVSHEHRLRCGEILAYGITLLLTEQRLQIPRQNFFFYEHTAARPDFVINLSQNHRFGVAWNRFRYGLESRWRKSQANLHQKDTRDLSRKKSSTASNILSGTIAVYCFYGTGSHHTNGVVKTRLHLADPPNRGEKMSVTESAEVVLQHYASVCSRIGLWEYRDYLQKVCEQFSNLRSEILQWEAFDSSAPNTSVVLRKYNGQSYVGTCYAPPEVILTNGDEVGPRFIYWGLNAKVLRMIRESSWDELITYCDENVKAVWDQKTKAESNRISNYSVSSDGVIKYQTSTPTSTDLKALDSTSSVND
ncbi:hypothetical protein Mal35_26610 [Gimesia maris]|uniref:hypothetical protein n=1 Tax=Gimesia maris TaxID=122 RepID=UPI001188777B|nr:hypothetical protein [Gimesia maris]QDT79206.1 hypothetical protein Mal35_26610 [Gimesia maris]